MTKAEKKALDAKKPFFERNYWYLTKSEKDQWLNHRGLNKSSDVIQPILIPFIGLAAIILAVVLFVLTFKTTGQGIFGKNKGLWYATEGIVAAIGLGVSIFLIIRMKREKKGWWINNYYSGNTSSVKRQQDQIESETQTTDAIAGETGNSDLDDLI